jgi:hypothetical protein
MATNSRTTLTLNVKGNRKIDLILNYVLVFLIVAAMAVAYFKSRGN